MQFSLSTFCLVLCSLATTAFGQSTLLKDINVSGSSPPSSSSPRGFLSTPGGFVLFSAREATQGSELWRTDGSVNGTFRIRDIAVGFNSSSPGLFTLLPSGLVMFLARTPLEGQELWRTDGTTSGTVLVADINPGTGDSRPYSLTALGNQLLFVADDGTSGHELWVTDSTTAGTHKVIEIGAGSASSRINQIAVLGPQATEAVFTVSRTTGSELWRTDGTELGTSFVTQINTADNLGATSFTSFGNLVLFRAETTTTGYEPWVTDGTAAGTFALAQIGTGAAGSGFREFTVIGGDAFFEATGALGSEIYRTDGTIPGTDLYADVATGALDSTPKFVGVSNGEGYFFADDATGERDFYRTDVATGGIVWLSSVGMNPRFSEPPGVDWNGELIFPGSGPEGIELWATDGTQGGTRLLADIQPGPLGSSTHSLARTSTGVAFGANDGLTSDEPWFTDGTTAGTIQLKDIFEGRLTPSSSPFFLGRFRQHEYMRVLDGTGGWSMWRTDGTEAGTEKFNKPGTEFPSGVTDVGDYFLFTNRTSGTGTEPWVSDGTLAGTKLLKNINAGANSSNAGPFFPYKGRVFFDASNQANGNELWVTDGTTIGTQLFMEFNSGTFAGSPKGFINYKGLMFFWASADGVGGEPHFSDGTTQGTSLLLDIRPGILSSNFSGGLYTASAGYLFFTANDGTNGEELWRTDGTPIGTILLKNIGPGAASANATGLIDLNGRLVFFADDGDGNAVWESDGTPGGTLKVQTLPHPLATVSQSRPVRFNDTDVVFWLYDGVTNTHLWKTDGTAAGTQLVRLISPGGLAGLTTIVHGQPARSRLVFSADDGVAGRRLWVSDGTFAGTVPISSTRPNSSGGAAYVQLGDSFLFASSDYLTGIELHSMPLATIDDWAAEEYGFGCPGTGGVVPSIGLTGVARESSPVPFSVDLAGALPNAPAFLLWSPFGTYLPLGSCALYVGPPFKIEVATTDSAGEAHVSFTPIPGLAGFVGEFQWAVLDPQGAFGGAFSISDALEIVGGF